MMINSLNNPYLQNSGLTRVTHGEVQTKSKSKSEDISNSDAVKLEISKESKLQMKIDVLQELLKDIFGEKKELTLEEKEQEKELISKIKNIEESEELPYSKIEKELIKNANVEIEKILNKGFYSYTDDEKLSNLTKELDVINKKYKSEVSFENEREKDILLNELHKLQGYKVPDVPDLINAKKINTKIDILKLEFNIENLDKNSTSYETNNKNFQIELKSLYHDLEQFDIQKDNYQKESLREKSKGFIKTSLSNIETIRTSFFEGVFSSSVSDNELFGMYNGTNTNTNTHTENKWLNFLQDTRKESYSPTLNSKLKNEDDDIKKLMNRINILHS